VELKKGVTRLVLVAVSAGILAWLWSKTGWADLGRAIRRLDPLWFSAALLMFVPQTWISAVRWCWIVRPWQPLGTWRSTELVLASSSLNVVLPSKMGDVLKGAFLVKDRPGGDLATGVGLGLFEKITDTAALAVVMLVASIFDPPSDPLSLFILACGLLGTIGYAVMLTPSAASRLARIPKLGRIGAVIAQLRADRGGFVRILAVSLFLWVLHMAQFSVAYVATGSPSPEIALLWSRVPIAIFIGLLPISFAGIGTRDAAMVYLLEDRIGEDAALVLGVVATLRYLVVALAGLPFVPKLRRESPAPPAPAAPAR
jgi:glycosyltransferase 2 family protein